jgi:hypothetical protein
LKVTVPVGLDPPLSVAVSVVEAPGVMDEEVSDVLSVVDTLPTARGSEPHELVDPALFESPA